MRVLASPSIASQSVGVDAVRPHGAAERARGSRCRRCCAPCARNRARVSRDSPASRCRPTGPDASRRSIRTSAEHSRCANRRATSRALGARRSRSPNCLNFGSPEKPEVMGDFAAAVRGIGDACSAFGIPVTGGNVSFYNESPTGAVHPTVDRRDARCARRRVCAPARRSPRDGDTIVLLGRPSGARRERSAAVIHGIVAGRAPCLDLDAEVALSPAARDARPRRLRARSVRRRPRRRARRDVHARKLRRQDLARRRCRSEGSDSLHPVWALFGESTARALITCSADEVSRHRGSSGVPAPRARPARRDHLDIDGVVPAVDR